MDAGIIDFAVYENGKEFLGMAKVTLPDVTNKTFTLSGAGIPGDIDIPIIGNKEAMKCTIEFIDNPKSAYSISEERRHLLDLRAAHEYFDKTKGKVVVDSYKHILEVIPISRKGGDVAPATSQGTSVEFSVISRKDYINNKLVAHIDPTRYIDIDASGVNRLSEVAKALGK